MCIASTVFNRLALNYVIELLGWIQILNEYGDFIVDKLRRTETNPSKVLKELTNGDREILRLSYTVLVKHESDLEKIVTSFLGD